MAAKFSPAADTLVDPERRRVARAHRGRSPPNSARRRRPALRRSSGIESARFDATRRAHRVRRRQGQDRGARPGVGAGGRRSAAARRPSMAPQFSPDGKHVAALPESGDVLVWRVDRRAARSACSRAIAAMSTRSPTARTAGSSPPGRTGRSASGPRGGAAVVMRGHEDEITTAVFTADGSTGAQLQPGRHAPPLGRAHGRARRGAAVRSGRDGRRRAERGTARSPRSAKGEVVRVFECEVLRQPRRRAALARSRAPRPLNARRAAAVPRRRRLSRALSCRQIRGARTSCLQKHAGRAPNVPPVTCLEVAGPRESPVRNRASTDCDPLPRPTGASASTQIRSRGRALGAGRPLGTVSVVDDPRSPRSGSQRFIRESR